MAFWLPRERYFLPILPLIHFAIWHCALWLERRLAGRASAVAVAGIVILLAVPNLLQDGTFIYEQRLRGVSPTDRRDPEGRALMEMGELIVKETRSDDVILAQAARELTYFSRRKVIAPPRSLRQPPSPKMEQRVREDVLAAPNVFVVLPDFREKHVENLFSELGMGLGPEVGRVEQGPWKGRPGPTHVLHRLIRKNPTPPAGTSPSPATPSPSFRPAG
jgi:hypothetical protein